MGVTANGQTFLFPTGTYCPTASNTVDPRIVTPTGTTVTNCPTGYFACYGQTTQCGRIFVNATTSTNGNSDFGAYPWQAYLNNATNSFPEASLLDSFHVLTAAHKVYLNENNPTAVTVSMGVWNPYNRVNVQSSTVRTITLHPNFKKTAPLDYKNDIAVLTLTQPIVLGIYSNINTACLPAAGASYTGQRCIVSGWGQVTFTNFSAPTNPQKQVTVPIRDYATCRASYVPLLGNNVDVYLDQAGEICAGGEAMIDACTQDGGSPLMCYDATTRLGYVTGLVIWGKNCGQRDVYGVYVNVPYYINWIRSITST
ncbi:hypothetical protein JTB14_026662 [Gonioctena quinquepunctata]|nr:hypothetical protein JTB14_026662 [Gonioctena quinquepunctata]